jgi:hypothetical protein
MSAITVANEVTIDHAKLGAELWEWSSEQQAKFLAEFGRTFRANPGESLMQLSYIVDELKKQPWMIGSVRWLNDHLTEYLKEDDA